MLASFLLFFVLALLEVFGILELLGLLEVLYMLKFLCIFLSEESRDQSNSNLVQSLNSPFFPPHIGAAPGQFD